MNIEDLKGDILTQLQELKDRITESPAYSNAKEQFEASSRRTQKMIIFGGLAFIIALMVYIPMSYVWQSQDYIAEYDEKREVIRELFKYGSLSESSSPLPAQTNSGSIVASIRSQLSGMQLLSEQIGSIEPAQGVGVALVKPPILQTDVTAKLKWLNLTQLVDVSYKLQNLKDSVKLTGVDINAATEKGKSDYFNVTYTLSSFSLPQSADKGSKRKSRRGRNK